MNVLVALTTATQHLQAALQPAETLQQLVNATVDRFGAQAAMVYFHLPEATTTASYPAETRFPDLTTTPQHRRARQNNLPEITTPPGQLFAAPVGAWLIVPLIQRGGQNCGVLHVFTSPQHSDTAELLLALTQLASLAAFAHENLRLFQAEQQARQVTETLRVANVALAQHLEVNTVLDTLLDYLNWLIPYDSASVMLLNAERQLVVRAWRSYDETGSATPPAALPPLQLAEHPVLQEVVNGLVSVDLPDTAQYPQWTLGAWQSARHWLGVPLVSEKVALGLFSLGKMVPHNFTAAHVRLAEALAPQALTALRNAQLHEETVHAKQALEDLTHSLERRVAERVEEIQLANARLARHAAQMEMVNQVGQQITATLQLNQLLAQVGQLLQACFGYYFVGIWLVDTVSATARLQTGTHRLGDLLSEQEVDLRAPGLLAEVYQTGQAQLLTDVQQRPPQTLRDELPATQARLALPLQMGEKIFGLLDIRADATTPLDPDALVSLQILANQLSVAMRNAQFYEQLEQMVQQRTEELQRAYQTLERMDKLKSSFIEVTAHELRTPITVIKGYAQVLSYLPAIQSTADNTALVDGVTTGANRLLVIVNNMLDMTKIDSQTLRVHARKVALYTIIGQVQTGFTTALRERKMTLTQQDLQALPPVAGDPDLLPKVFNQLIVNAIKYTPDGGAITVSGRAFHEAGRGWVEVVVSDTGIGIDPAHQSLIFEKFYQTGEVAFHSSGLTKFKGGGPGLGLAIARGIVLAHGGKIWATSPGHDEAQCPGSQFFVQLPMFVE